MDWAKSKNIMLVMLLILNLFLITRITTYASNRETPSATIKNTEAILHSRDIVLDCDIPRYQEDVARLVLGDYDYDKNMLDKSVTFTDDNRVIYKSAEAAAHLEERLSEDSAVEVSDISNSKIKSAEDYARNILNESGLLSNSYVLDEVKQNPDGSVELNFIEKFEEMLVFDNYATVTLTDKEVAQYEAKRREIAGFSPEKLNDFAAAYQILLKNYGMDTVEDVDEDANDKTLASAAMASKGSTSSTGLSESDASDIDKSDISNSTGAAASGVDKPVENDKNNISIIANFGNMIKEKLTNSSGSGLDVGSDADINSSEGSNTGQDNVDIMTITHIDLGYKEPYADEDEQLNPQGIGSLQTTQQPPVWRVKVKGDDSPRYFDATSGEELLWK